MVNRATVLRFLLTAPPSQVELFTELIGTMIFALLGGVADPNGTGRDGCGLARPPPQPL